MEANILLTDTPSTLGVGSKGQTISFSESSHVAYQIKADDAGSNMVANILPTDTPSFFMEVTNTNPDQTDLGPYYLEHRLPENISRGERAVDQSCDWQGNWLILEPKADLYLCNSPFHMLKSAL